MKRIKIYIVAFSLIVVILVSYIIHIKIELKEVRANLNVEVLISHLNTMPESFSNKKIPEANIRNISSNIDDLNRFNTILNFVSFNWQEDNWKEISDLNSRMRKYLSELLLIREKMFDNEELAKVELDNYEQIYIVLHSFFAELNEYENNDIDLYNSYKKFKEKF